MERDIWKSVMRALRRVRATSPPRAQYTNRDILAVLLWAALHDRPVSWACLRQNWPVQAWRRRLPDQSTMSRRMRDPALVADLTAVIGSLQRAMPRAATLIADGKAFALSDRTGDPDACNGWASRGYAPGYKLHAIIDTGHRLVAFDVRPMNAAEPTVTRELVLLLRGEQAEVLLADSAYDSNPLHGACAGTGLTLLAPRRRPGTSISDGHRQHPARVAAVRLIEGPEPPAVLRERSGIERFFSRLVIAARLFALPPWVRRLHRVRLWVSAKLALNAARIARLRGFAA